MVNGKVGYGKNKMCSYKHTHNSAEHTAVAGVYTVKVYRTGNNSASCIYYIDDVLITHQEVVNQQICLDYGSYRYGYGGHEKVDEVSGTGNTVDMGDRWLDVRLGRTAKPDKQAHKYPFISPYSYALNSPILFIDPDGEDVVVAFGGLDYNNSGDAGSALKLVNDLKVWAEANNIEDFDAEAFASDWIDNAQDKAIKFIEDNYSKGEKIIIYGYSWGGDNAVELTETLKEKGYEVDLLIMVDAAKGPLSGDLGDWVDREIPDNTKEATNYYQKNPSKVRSHGNEAKAKDPKKTSVMNVEVTTEGISHSNIDEEVAPLVKEEIKNKVNE